MGKSGCYAEILINYIDLPVAKHAVQNAEFLQSLNFSWSVLSSIQEEEQYYPKTRKGDWALSYQFIDAGTDYRKLCLISLWYSLHSQRRKQNLQKS